MYVCISATVDVLQKFHNFNFLLINLILPPRSHFSILSVNSISHVLKANFLSEVCHIVRRMWKQPLILSVLYCHYYSYYVSWPSDAMHLWDWGKLAETCPRAASQLFHLRMSYHLLGTLPGSHLWFHTLFLGSTTVTLSCAWASRTSLLSFLTPKIFLFLWNLI